MRRRKTFDVCCWGAAGRAGNVGLTRSCRESSLRVILVIFVLCLVSAVYSGHRIVSETHFPRSDARSPVPGVSRSLHRDSTATLEQEQRIRAARLALAETHPASTLDTIVDALSGR